MSSRNPLAENIPLLEADEVEDEDFETSTLQPSLVEAAHSNRASQQSSTSVDAAIRDYTAPPQDDGSLEAPPSYNAPSWSNSVPLEVELDALAETAAGLPR